MEALLPSCGAGWWRDSTAFLCCERMVAYGRGNRRWEIPPKGCIGKVITTEGKRRDWQAQHLNSEVGGLCTSPCIPATSVFSVKWGGECHVRSGTFHSVSWCTLVLWCVRRHYMVKITIFKTKKETPVYKTGIVCCCSILLVIYCRISQGLHVLM